MKKMIPYGRQSIDRNDIRAVTNVLKSDWLTQGSKVREFENKIASYCGCRFAVVVSNGTAALHLACLAAGLKRGNDAVTTPLSFVATANAVLFAGARPVFADVDRRSGNISPREIEKKITKGTRAIIPVDFGGLPADLMEISSVAAQNKILIIEDACHALGASYHGKKVGSCFYSDMTVFSFHPVKNITTGEGGCITTNNRKLYQKLISLREHGIRKTNVLRKKYGGWFYEMFELGYNYRLSDIQCALGISQLRKISRFIKRRTEIARRYNEAFRNLMPDVSCPDIEFDDRTHALHLYQIRIKFRNNRVNRRSLYEFLAKNGVGTQVHYIPIYQHPYFKQLDLPQKRMPNAEAIYKETLSLPLYPGLKEREISKVIHAVHKYFK